MGITKIEIKNIALVGIIVIGSYIKKQKLINQPCPNKRKLLLHKHLFPTLIPKFITILTRIIMRNLANFLDSFTGMYKDNVVSYVNVFAFLDSNISNLGNGFII